MTHRKRRYLVTPGPAIVVPTGQRWAPGWYVALQRGDIFAGASYTGIPNASTVSNVGPVSLYTQGLLVPHDWREFEPNGATDPFGSRFDFSKITADLADVANLSAIRDAARAAAHLPAMPPLMYALKLTVKSFRGLGTNPLPTDLQQPLGTPGTAGYSPDGRATYFPGGGGVPDGYSTWRWDATVISRFNVLLQQIGANFDSHPNFGFIATQETSTSYTPVTAVDGFSVASYQNGLIAEAVNIAAACPHVRPVAFINFMPKGGRADLELVAAHIQPTGAMLAGPDLCTNLSPSGIVNTCYAIYKDYHFGTHASGLTLMPGTGPTGCSIQKDEWTGVSPPADPLPVNLQDLYNYATSTWTYGNPGTPAMDHRPNGAHPSPLNLDVIFIDWHTTGTPKFNHDGTDLMAANPTFGTWP